MAGEERETDLWTAIPPARGGQCDHQYAALLFSTGPFYSFDATDQPEQGYPVVWPDWLRQDIAAAADDVSLSAETAACNEGMQGY